MDSFLSMMALVATIVELIISAIGLIYEFGKKGEKKREAPAETWSLDRRPINLHERHIMRRSLIGDAFQDAGKMKDVGLIQVFGSIVFCFLALALVVANALCLAFLDEDRASITEIILVVPALICLLFSAYFLICSLFKVIRFRDIPQRLIGMLFTLCSKKKGVHLALSNIEGLVGNYANCLVIHADE